MRGDFPTEVYVVTGGRSFRDAALVALALDTITIPNDVIVQGGAMGADSLARAWARDNGRCSQTVEADWLTYGKAAGPIRNREMLTMFPVKALIAFPGGRGTANCVATATELGIQVIEIRPGWKPVCVRGNGGLR